MAGVRLDLQVTGIKETLQALNVYKDEQLAEAANKGITRGLQRAAVPALKSAAPEGHGSDPWERIPNGKRKGGPINRKITARAIRKRPGEMAARKVGPNTWYDSWVITGTKPHVITASHAAGRATTRQVRAMNRGRSLLFNGIFAEQVNHPGARPNPFVGRVAANPSVQGAVKAAIVEELNKPQKLRTKR